MFFVTCLNDVWRRNAKRMRGLMPLERDAQGRAVYERESSSARCFGYFITQEEAVAAVEANACDIHECWYTLCVIEELEPGIHPMGWFEGSGIATPLWYEWKGTSEQGTWQRVECPEEAQGTVNFALG